MRYHLMLVRVAIIKKTRSNKCCRKCGEKGTLVHRWWEYKSAQPLWKAVWSFLKKLKTELPDDPTIPLPGIYLKKCKHNAKENAHVHSSTSHKSQSRKPKCPPTDERMKKCRMCAWVCTCIRKHTGTPTETMEYSAVIEKRKSCHA